jgi:hypothetical protein
MEALGYVRGAPPAPDGTAYYSAYPRPDWPLGADQEPWSQGKPSPGTYVSIAFVPEGRTTTIAVTVTVLCAVESTKKSRDRHGVEHAVAVYSALQIFGALDGKLEEIVAGHR